MINKSQKILEVSHLKTYFKVGIGKRKLKVKAVDDISFDVYKGEVVGIVGESGCGKTTTARTIVRLYRPTDGTIKFEGNVIGAGHNEYYRLMKYRRIDYKREKLELDSRAFEIFKIKEKFNAQISKLEKEIEGKKAEAKAKIAEVTTPKDLYDKSMFQLKSDYQLQKEIDLVNYTNKKEALRNRTINEYQVELNDALKSVKKTLKQKLSGIKSSAGLDKQGKQAQIEFALKRYQDDINELNTNYAPKIEKRSKNLLSKEDYKLQLVQLKEEYEQTVLNTENEFNQKFSSIEVPNTEENKAKIAEINEKLNADIDYIKTNIKQLKDEMKSEINGLPKGTTINKEALAVLKDEYNTFMNLQKSKIREARELHYNSAAKKVHEKIQMIYQDPISSLNPRMTVQEIVAEGLIIKGIKDKKFLESEVARTLQLVGLPPEFASRYPHEFSGGQRQRIGIARALIMNSKFIIADEPISALDVSIRAQVINLLTELREKLELTILFVAHDLSVVRFFCDRIIVMFAGKIVEMGDTEAIFKNPLHPYTKSLLSAIPQPDPDSEKTRQRIVYNPGVHNYATDKPSLREVTPDHMVYANDQEFELILKELKK